MTEEEIDNVYTNIMKLVETEEDSYNVPDMEDSEGMRFPVIMKSPRVHDRVKNEECKKCIWVKKQFEEEIERLENKIQARLHELFELYSFLNARLSEIDRKHK